MARFRTLIVAALLASALAGCGGSSSPRDKLSGFVVDYVDHNRNNCCELGMHATVSHVTFAASDPRWAFVRIAVTDSAGRPDGYNFLLVRETGSTWNVVGFGKGTLGCLAPVRVRAELAVGAPNDVMSCP